MSLFPYHRPDDPAVGEPVAPRIAQTQDAGTPIRAAMLDRLGSHVWHGSPAEASSVLEELEETARLWPLTRAASLDPKQIDELRRQFGAAW